MVRQKTISLDEKTAIIAGRMPNFSAWVRNQLIQHARTAEYPKEIIDDGYHVAPSSARVWGEHSNKCNPKHKNGMCDECWGDA